MNQIVDHILLIALDENITYGEKRDRIERIIENSRTNERDTEINDLKETINDFYERPEFRDYERD